MIAPYLNPTTITTVKQLMGKQLVGHAIATNYVPVNGGRVAAKSQVFLLAESQSPKHLESRQGNRQK